MAAHGTTLQPSGLRPTSSLSDTVIVTPRAPESWLWRATWLFRNGLVLGLVASAALSWWVLVSLHGLEYYRTPLAVRGYAAAHRLLKPSGELGLAFGIAGMALLLVPFFYSIRKRFPSWTWAGSLEAWLEVHVFAGIVGPVLVTFHTSFKFNGIVSAGYWSLVVVTVSGFIGKYLQARILRARPGAAMERLKTAFGHWHVFHVPFVYIFLVIAILHIAVVVYLGYVPFRW